MKKKHTWRDPYYVTIDVAEELSAHARGQIYVLAREKKIASTNIDPHGQIYSTVFSLRDLLIYERDQNCRGQESVVGILESLKPLVYTSGKRSNELTNRWRGKGTAKRLENQKSIYRSEKKRE